MRSPIAATALRERMRRERMRRNLIPQTRGPARREGGSRTVPFSDPNSPEATGGGSLGYNRTVPHW